ncbi:hypothetical protein [Phenylobacterium montanum]|uniref:Uncharacterized protein n=1 Tax=Phenylobacterium montanum TaxID=2823693 RepID=A0A975IVR2_9CAUL|nr:hypothetical protein [Caulobacter sp. S6]QUD89118.1 hypothetical protein KCG34_04320 [Caulobacter sp. S6]
MHQPEPSDFDDACAADPVSVAAMARGVAERQVAFLDRLAEAGTRMAEALAQRTVEDAAGGKDVEGLDRAFQKVTRAVRLTLALQTKAIKDLAALEAGQAPAAAVAAVAAEDPLERRRRRIARIVNRVVADDEATAWKAERLCGRVWERLSDEDIYGDVLSKPIGVVIEMICRDLQIPVNWVHLAREAWAVEETASGDETSPFVAPDGAYVRLFRPPPMAGAP